MFMLFNENPFSILLITIEFDPDIERESMSKLEMLNVPTLVTDIKEHDMIIKL
jgi:hypothetical protein